MSKDIFDLNDLSDIPSNLDVRLLKVHTDTVKLLELFEIKDSLNVDEILVGLYRKYRLVKSRVWASSTLYNLKQRGILKKLKQKGAYKLIKQTGGVEGE